jgi:mannose-6-phosphate isomerase-like protein (cupin superfamily)
MMVVSKNQPLSHYIWGNACDGWNLVADTRLSVKLERMPPGTEESLHYHQQAQQFFFIVRGEAEFEIEEKKVVLKEQEGIQILPMEKHLVRNRTKNDLEFIVCSQPSTQGDRHNLE